MFNYYLKLALSNLFRQRLFTWINVIGLAIGLASCILITLFVLHERSYDRAFSSPEDIYRVSAIFQAQQVFSEEAMLTYRAVDLLENDFPEILHAARLINIEDSPLISLGEIQFYEDGFYLADSGFFTIFDFPFLAGDPVTALTDPASVVITESVAARYFGNENLSSIIGQTLELNKQDRLRITGIIQDLPSNTHFDFSVLVSESSIVSLYGGDMLQNLASWGWPSTYTYVQLLPGTDWNDLQAKFPEFMDRNDGQEELSLHLQPLSSIHLHSDLELEMVANGDIRQVTTFSAIALLVLLIACINFMNLATARSTVNAKDVGIRLVMGAERPQVAIQYLVQSMLLTLIALILAIIFVQAALPVFNSFLGKELSVGYLDSPLVIPGLLLFGVTIGLLTGSYPALYLSGAQPALVLKGGQSLRLGIGLLRKSLVIIQFAVAITLLVATGVILAQMRFASDLELGYDKEQIVIVSGRDGLDFTVENFQSLSNSLLQHSQISSVTYANYVPTDKLFSGTGFRRVGDAPEDGLFYRFNDVGYDYFETLSIDMATGRTFSREMGTDAMVRRNEGNPHTQASIIMNAAGAAKAGWTPEEALGKQLMQGGPSSSVTYTVVGITEDIYFSSVHEVVEPVIYRLSSRLQRLMAIKISSVNIPGTLAYIDEAWKQVEPAFPITRNFLDARFDALYEEEARNAAILTSFALLAVCISCLGLLGLAAFISEQRRKEIGVRKVLGCSVLRIVLLLSWDFTKLVLIANLIAWPAAYLLMNNWLGGFAYRIDLNPLLFAEAGAIAFLIAWLTVGWQASRAALVNPVECLRQE